MARENKNKKQKKNKQNKIERWVKHKQTLCHKKKYTNATFRGWNKGPTLKQCDWRKLLYYLTHGYHVWNRICDIVNIYSRWTFIPFFNNKCPDVSLTTVKLWSSMSDDQLLFAMLWEFNFNLLLRLVKIWLLPSCQIQLPVPSNKRKRAPRND